VIAEDVTERKALEDQFRQARRWKPSVRSPAASPRLQQLLTVISGYSQILMEPASGDPHLSRCIERFSAPPIGPPRSHANSWRSVAPGAQAQGNQSEYPDRQRGGNAAAAAG